MRSSFHPLSVAGNYYAMLLCHKRNFGVFLHLTTRKHARTHTRVQARWRGWGWMTGLNKNKSFRVFFTTGFFSSKIIVSRLKKRSIPKCMSYGKVKDFKKKFTSAFSSSPLSNNGGNSSLHEEAGEQTKCFIYLILTLKLSILTIV